MENWKIFLEESESITINPEGMTPKFFQGELDENLEESDQARDPEALSIEKLKKISTKEIQEAYAQMSKVESSRQEPRKKKHQSLTKQRKKAEDELYDSDQNQDIFVFFVEKGKELLNQVLRTNFETATTKQQKVKNMKAEIKKMISDEFTPLQREIIRAIFVFTGLSVPAVRDPSNFMADQAAGVKYLNDGIEMYFTPTRETYKKAKIILEKLQDTPIQDVPVLWRGLSVPVKGSTWPGLEKYKVGSTLDVGNIMSFSINSKVARDFADGEVSFPWSWPVLLQIEKGDLLRGVDVDQFSEFEGQEKEVIVGGKFTIKEITTMTVKGQNINRTHSDFQSAWKSLGWADAWEMASDSDRGDELMRFFADRSTRTGGLPRKMIFIVKIKQKA